MNNIKHCPECGMSTKNLHRHMSGDGQISETFRLSISSFMETYGSKRLNLKQCRRIWRAIQKGDIQLNPHCASQVKLALA